MVEMVDKEADIHVSVPATSVDTTPVSIILYFKHHFKLDFTSLIEALD